LQRSTPGSSAAKRAGRIIEGITRG
jgi:hypothetical protein